jgi:DNA-binding YbaB/EbfC family protein
VDFGYRERAESDPRSVEYDPDDGRRLKDLSDIMRQAQQMQQRLAEAQEKMEQITADGAAGGGLVTVTLKGKGELASLRIDPSLMAPGDREMVEDLIRPPIPMPAASLTEAMASYEGCNRRARRHAARLQTTF